MSDNITSSNDFKAGDRVMVQLEPGQKTLFFGGTSYAVGKLGTIVHVFANKIEVALDACDYPSLRHGYPDFKVTYQELAHYPTTNKNYKFLLKSKGAVCYE